MPGGLFVKPGDYESASDDSGTQSFRDKTPKQGGATEKLAFPQPREGSASPMLQLPSTAATGEIFSIRP